MAILLFLVASGCGSDSALTVGANQVTYWNAVLLDIIRVEKTPPPLAARNLAVLHIALFDALNALSPRYRSYAYDFDPDGGTGGAKLETAVAASAARRALAYLYPTHATQLDALYAPLLAALPDGSAKDASVALGEAAAGAIFELRRRDDGTVMEPVPAAGPLVWVPTPPAYLPGLLPGWGKVTPFAMTSGSQFRQAGPPAVGSAAYGQAFSEVRALGAATSVTRSPDQTAIASFWSDGAGTVTPPGHWNQIAATVAISRGLSLLETARLFALVNVALADAGIAAWDMKYTFWAWRPHTAITRADTTGNLAAPADPAWTSLLVTPNFPEYVSGHSTFSAAAARVLANFFGNDAVPFQTVSDGLPGVARSFPSFSAAAAEAGKSRIYGGIHFDYANRDGQAAGTAIGDWVTSHVFVAR